MLLGKCVTSTCHFSAAAMSVLKPLGPHASKNGWSCAILGSQMYAYIYIYITNVCMYVCMYIYICEYVSYLYIYIDLNMCNVCHEL